MTEETLIILGEEKGEVCNRDGCTGIIDEYEKDGSCSCHINPPCGYCEEDNRFCPECNWYAKEDYEHITLSKNDKKHYEDSNRKWHQWENDIQKQMRGEIPVKKLDWYTESHTNFTMKKIGCHPNMSMPELSKHLRGTFGGRFERYDEKLFVYIAYTD